METKLIAVEKKKYDSLDLLKFIACIFVVALHSGALYDINPTLNLIINEGIARLAVPIFFTISAFFFFKKEHTSQSVKRYCFRILKLYLCWFIVSLPKTIFDRIICSKYGITETIIRFIRSFFVTSTFSGSWFLVSCVFCAILFYLLEKMPDTKRRIITIYLSVIVYFFATITSGYGNILMTNGFEAFLNVYKMIFANPYNNLFVGIPYFALGRFLAKRDPQKLNNKSNIWLLGVTLVLLIAEVLITSHYELSSATDCYFMLLPCTYFVMTVFLNWNISIKRAKQMRTASTIIFFSHFLWLFGAEILEWVLHISIPSYMKFVIGISGGLLTSYLIVSLQRVKHLSWLRYFY